MIRYVLGAMALLIVAAPAQAEEKPDRDAPDAMRCVKIAETGSLVRKQKVCKTNAEWTRLSQNERRDADEFIQSNRSGSSSN